MSREVAGGFGKVIGVFYADVSNRWASIPFVSLHKVWNPVKQVGNLNFDKFMCILDTSRVNRHAEFVKVNKWNDIGPNIGSPSIFFFRL